MMENMGAAVSAIIELRGARHIMTSIIATVSFLVYR